MRRIGRHGPAGGGESPWPPGIALIGKTNPPPRGDVTMKRFVYWACSAMFLAFGGPALAACAGRPRHHRGTAGRPVRRGRRPPRGRYSFAAALHQASFPTARCVSDPHSSSGLSRPSTRGEAPVFLRGALPGWRTAHSTGGAGGGFTGTAPVSHGRRLYTRSPAARTERGASTGCHSPPRADGRPHLRAGVHRALCGPSRRPPPPSAARLTPPPPVHYIGGSGADAQASVGN